MVRPKVGLVIVKFFDDCSHEVLVALVVIVVFYVAADEVEIASQVDSSK